MKSSWIRRGNTAGLIIELNIIMLYSSSTALGESSVAELSSRIELHSEEI